MWKTAVFEILNTNTLRNYKCFQGARRFHKISLEMISNVTQDIIISCKISEVRDGLKVT